MSLTHLCSQLIHALKISRENETPWENQSQDKSNKKHLFLTNNYGDEPFSDTHLASDSPEMLQTSHHESPAYLH